MRVEGTGDREKESKNHSHFPVELKINVTKKAQHKLVVAPSVREENHQDEDRQRRSEKKLQRSFGRFTL